MKQGLSFEVAQGRKMWRRMQRSIFPRVSVEVFKGLVSLLNDRSRTLGFGTCINGTGG